VFEMGNGINRAGFYTGEKSILTSKQDNQDAEGRICVATGGCYLIQAG